MNINDLEHLDPALMEEALYQLELMLEKSVPPMASTLLTAPSNAPPTYELSPALPATHTKAQSSTSYLPLAAIIIVAMVLVALGMTSSFLSSPMTSPPSSTIPPDTTYEVPGTWNVQCPGKPPVYSGGTYSVIGRPSITVKFIDDVLDHYQSPAREMGQFIYYASVRCAIDPIYTLAFFMHESTFGNAGEARNSLSPGNLRCIPNFRCIDGYAWFDSWQDGFNVYCRLIRNLYVDSWGRSTVDQIIPKYAPQADNNNEANYIWSLKHAVDTWHKGIVEVTA